MSSIRNSRNRTAATHLAQLVSAAQWRTRSACAGKSDLPWFDDTTAAAAACMPICRECPVRTECLTEAISFDATTEHAQAGTMGASTAAQRSWLTHNPDLAAELYTHCADSNINVDELADYWHTVGPEALPADAASLDERDIAARWGVNTETWMTWLTERGLSTRKPKSLNRTRDKQHIDAYDTIRQHLRRCRSEGNPWVPQIGLTDLIADAMPLSAVTPTVTAKTRSTRRAWNNIVASVIQSWERQGGLIERKPDPDQPTRKLIRWIGP